MFGMLMDNLKVFFLQQQLLQTLAWLLQILRHCVLQKQYWHTKSFSYTDRCREPDPKMTILSTIENSKQFQPADWDKAVLLLTNYPSPAEFRRQTLK